VKQKAKRRARRLAKRPGVRRQRHHVEQVAGVISVDQDTGDDCMVCLFIRARAHRADVRGLIALSVAEVGELRELMAGP
jgi:hypothetical protein